MARAVAEAGAAEEAAEDLTTRLPHPVASITISRPPSCPDRQRGGSTPI